MLVLSRYAGEKIYIGPDVEIVVVEVREDGRVRLGIEAPKEVEIVRDDAGRKGWRKK